MNINRYKFVVTVNLDVRMLEAWWAGLIKICFFSGQFLMESDTGGKEYPNGSKSWGEGSVETHAP
jgi:hypothetical protein